MSRIIMALGAAGLLLTASPAPAQFFGGGIGGFRGVPPLRPLAPLAPLPQLTPGFVVPYYGYRQAFGIATPGGGGIGFAYAFRSWGVGPWAYYPGFYGPGYPVYGSSPGGYMTGGSASDAAARDFARAQQQAVAAGKQEDALARPRIAEQWDYENGVAAKKLPEIKGGTSPEAQDQAAREADPAKIATGEPLNHLLYAVVAADTRNAKLPSLYLRPDLLSQVRFTGSPAAEALTLLRGGKPEFPAAFDDPALADNRAAVEKELTAVLAPLKANRPADSAAVTRLAAAVKAAQDKLTPALRDLPFDDAVAARRFLNQLDATAKVLREPSSAGLLNAKWATDGSSVSELTRYMAKHKLLFAAADKGDEEVYTTLHRGLVGYLQSLREFNAPKK